MQMTQRQILEAKAIADQLDPAENECGICCIAPVDLAHKFYQYLQDNGTSSEVFHGTFATDELKFSEVRLQSPLPVAQELVKDFAIHLATQADENVPGYWGGSMPG